MPTTGRRGSSRPWGFTLIELLLVVTLIAVLTGVMFPRLRRSVRSKGLSEGAEELAEFVRFARAQAVRRHLRTQLSVSKDQTEFWIEIQEPEAVYEEQFTEFGDSFLDGRRRLPPSVVVKRIYRGGHPTALDAIVFTPDGISDGEYSIELSGEEGRAKYVVMGTSYDEVWVRDELSMNEAMEGATG